MFVALEKYRTNISEYVLYMFHIEDIIRANKFDIKSLEENVISAYHLPEKETNQIKDWYLKLIEQLKRNDAVVSGHTKALNELINNLNDLHISLLNDLEEEQYLQYYHWAKPIIEELKRKMKTPSATEIEVCFNGLYGYMLLKMKQKEISNETAEAFSVFSQILRYLSRKYHGIK